MYDILYIPCIYSTIENTCSALLQQNSGAQNTIKFVGNEYLLHLIVIAHA